MKIGAASGVSNLNTGNSTGAAASKFTNLEKGDMFAAEIKDIRPNRVVLGLNNGETVEAKTSGLFGASIGDNAVFAVKESQGRILLEMVKPDESSRTNFIKDALLSAELPVNEKTAALALKMMEAGIPLDKETLETAVFFKYQAENGSSDGSLHGAGGKIGTDEILFMLSEKIPKTESAFVAASKIMGGENITKGIENILKNLFAEPPQNYDLTKPVLTLLTESPVAENAPAALQRKLSDLVKDPHLLSDENTQKEFINTVKEAVHVNLSKETSHGEITKIYENLAKTLDEVIKSIPGLTETARHARKEDSARIAEPFNDLSDNIDFLSRIQYNKNYFCFPFAVSGNFYEGEIHVLKESGKDGKNFSSVLVSLDLPALGLLESFITKINGRYAVRLEAENNKTLSLLRKNTGKLHRLLSAKSISADITFAKLDKRTPIAFASSNTDNNSAARKKIYNFDVRV